MFATGAVAILSVVYTVAHYTNREHLRKYTPKKDFPVVRIYKQDNTPCAVKLVWWIYISATANAFMVFLGYWGFIYSACEDSGGDGVGMNANSSNSTSGMGSGMGSNDSDLADCSVLDVHAIQVHGINLFLVILDLLISRIPYQFLHLFYPSIFSTAYIIFSLIYWGVGGTNHTGQPYIYPTLDYSSNPLAAFYAVVIIVAPMVLHLLLFLLAWLRDVIYMRIGCCFRDVKELPYQDAEGRDMNGVTSEEMTKV